MAKGCVIEHRITKSLESLPEHFLSIFFFLEMICANDGLLTREQQRTPWPAINLGRCNLT